MPGSDRASLASGGFQRWQRPCRGGGPLGPSPPYLARSLPPRIVVARRRCRFFPLTPPPSSLLSNPIRGSCVKTHLCGLFYAQGRVADWGLCVKSAPQACFHARLANSGDMNLEGHVQECSFRRGYQQGDYQIPNSGNKGADFGTWRRRAKAGAPAAVTALPATATAGELDPQAALLAAGAGARSGINYLWHLEG